MRLSISLWSVFLCKHCSTHVCLSLFSLLFHCCITPQGMRFPNHVMLTGRHLPAHQHHRHWLILVYLTGHGPIGNCWKSCPAPGCGFFIPVEKKSWNICSHVCFKICVERGCVPSNGFHVPSGRVVWLIAYIRTPGTSLPPCQVTLRTLGRGCTRRGSKQVSHLKDFCFWKKRKKLQAAV